MKSSQRVTIGTNVMNFVGLNSLCWLSVDRLCKVAMQSGYDDFEWHPIINTIPSFLFNHGFVSEETKEYIGSLHQSWRTEKTFSKAWNHRSKNSAVGSYFFLHNEIRSLEDLEKVQKIVGRLLPIVVNPTDEAEKSLRSKHFQDVLLQTVPSTLKQWKVKTVKDFIKQAQERGYTGLCLDLHHFRQSETIGLDGNHWEKTFTELLSFTKELHIAAGRVDVAYTLNTQEELADLVNGTRKTELTKMLERIGKEKWQGRAIVEAPCPALAIILKREKKLTLKEFIDGHKRIVSSISNLIR